MALSSKHVDPALCQLARGRGMTGTVRGGGKDVVAHSLVTSHLTTIVIENKVNVMKCMASVWVKTECNCVMYLQAG